MKLSLFLFFATLVSSSSVYAIDWQNPPVMCPEEILPKGIPCPDFSKVQNVYTDFPDNFSKEDIKDWKLNKAADLTYCKNKEVIRRESLKPGTYSKGTIENAWMLANGGENVREKLDAINAASLKYQIPPQILMGAMRQESLLSSLGVSPDGGNYSCGMSQINIQEWCNAANKLSTAEKINIGWPVNNISCEDNILPTDIVKSFYDIAITKIGARASYELTEKDFDGITFDQVSTVLPKGNPDLQAKRFEAITSFVKHCRDIATSVDFKASTLHSLFVNFIPKELQNQNLYANGETFKRACNSPYALSAYPLHTGWLLAVAMYNAGPRQRDVVDNYFQIKKNNYPTLSPLDLIEALHWSGKAKWNSNLLEFKDQNGNKFTQTWFKSCIVQRHVARVIQHTTLPGESIANSLEQNGCKSDGTIPDYRKKSSGVK